MQKYKKGLSKETIRILSQNFKISQDALNKPYALKLTPPIKIRTIKKRPAARKIARAL
ncbi:hypothetical protein [Sediminibacterium sp. TEGAF015]|uniref:hypothetical protein n=1 Tax=Sediminibacterium sp. TEGAF015 TaxID=575378 RepID=UPI00222FC680|nr:hypothetical protein [Sediminibacterium sp. TEGAF015]